MNLVPIKYKRVLLKLSGESLSGDQNFGIDENVLSSVAQEISEIVALGAEIGIVVGGGNIFRGGRDGYIKVDSISGDNMGMLATMINGIALKEILRKFNVNSEIFSSIDIPKIFRFFRREDACTVLEKKMVAIFVGGTGNPRVTTDTAASLKAIEISANILLKATRVDGVYSKDPEKDKDAKFYEKISFDEVFLQKLGVMDIAAFSMCMENRMPILVFNFTKRGNLKRVVLGEKVGTIVE